VVNELSSDGTPAKVRGWLTVAPGWLRIEPVGPEHADLLLVDDSDGRFEARRLRMRVTGTLGVLRVAAELSFIDVNAVVRSLPATNFLCRRRSDPFGFWEVAGLRRFAINEGAMKIRRRESNSRPRRPAVKRNHVRFRFGDCRPRVRPARKRWLSPIVRSSRPNPRR
jgi:hypothetical protein